MAFAGPSTNPFHPSHQPQPRPPRSSHSHSHSPPTDPRSAGDLPSSLIGNPEFDIFAWHPAYLSCQRYFLDIAQYEASVQAVAALINICLPFQWTAHPITHSAGHAEHGTGPGAYNLPWPRHGPMGSARPGASIAWVSLVPYIRRLVVTGFDVDAILHGFFGDDWKKGVGPLQECERRNYLFAAKSAGWSKVKAQYDMSPHETVPFMKPLQNVQLAEIEGAEKTWSQWLCMEDWMLGPRAPDIGMDEAPQGASQGQRIKTER